MTRIIIFLMLLAGCSASHVWDDYTLDEYQTLRKAGYDDIDKWWVHGYMEKHENLTAGKYRTDVIKINEPRPFRVHVWLWPYCANNRAHLEVYDCGSYATLYEAMLVGEKKVLEIENIFLEKGVIRCYHSRSKTRFGTIRWLTPAQWIAENDSVENARIDGEIRETRSRLDSLTMHRTMLRRAGRR